MSLVVYDFVKYDDWKISDLSLATKSVAKKNLHQQTTGNINKLCSISLSHSVVIYYDFTNSYICKKVFLSLLKNTYMYFTYLDHLTFMPLNTQRSLTERRMSEGSFTAGRIGVVYYSVPHIPPPKKIERKY